MAGGGGAGFAFDNSYARLPERFFVPLAPTPVPAPRLIRLNEALARQLGADPRRLDTPEGAAILAGNRVPDGAEPLAIFEEVEAAVSGSDDPGIGRCVHGAGRGADVE